MQSPPAIRVSLRDGEQALQAVRWIEARLAGRACATVEKDIPCAVQLVSPEDVGGDGPEPVVVVGSPELPQAVTLLAAHPSVDHVVPARSFQDGLCGQALERALDRLVGGGRRPCELPGLAGRAPVVIHDSAERDHVIARIAATAEQAGLSVQAIGRIRDVAEEVITTALYDAPSERDGKLRTRSSRVTLDERDGCTVTHGMQDELFWLRVTDAFGTLRRKRLLEVLQRCARGEEVDLDTSRGGAGLGMWRIFNAAALVMVEVIPDERTEIVIAIDPRRRARTDGRAVHLFWERGA